jgi:hypothetical protein
MRTAICIKEFEGTVPKTEYSVYGRLQLCKIYKFRKLRGRAGYSVYDELTKTQESVTTGIPMDFKTFDTYLMEIRL